MLLDEMAETQQLIDTPYKSVISVIGGSSETPSGWKEGRLSLQDVFECLNLKLLNIQHPFLVEIINFCFFFLNEIELSKDAFKKEDKERLYKTISESLANLTTDHEVVEVCKAALECVNII